MSSTTVSPTPVFSAETRPLQPSALSQTSHLSAAVLAAVDDSPLAAAVVGRAAALAVAENRELVLLTVVPAGSPASALDTVTRLAATVSALALEPRVMAAEYLARGGQRRQSRRIGATILRAARAAGAAVIVVGLPDEEHGRDRSVSRRVAHGAPAATRVTLVTRPAATEGGEGLVEAYLAFDSRAVALPRPPGTPYGHPLHAAHRRQLARRAARLQSVELPRLRRALLSSVRLPSGERDEMARRYEAGLQQLRTLQHLLDTP